MKQLPYEICDMCKECIKRHKKNKKEFNVRCIPLPKEMDSEKPYYPLEKILGTAKYKQLDDKVKIQVQMEKNKLLWAKECLGWTPYNADRQFYQYYQQYAINCTALNKVLRMGRRLGKCVEENSIIRTANRGPIKCKNLKSTDKLITYNEKRKLLHSTNRWIIQDNGIKECIEVIAEGNRIDTVTTNHPYLAIKADKQNIEWVEAEKLKPGDTVFSASNYKHKSNKLIPIKILKITNVGLKKTYAITVPETHTFVTNDIITHNTELSTVVILHYAFHTKKKKPILIIAPFQNLIDEIFDRLEHLLNSETSIYRGKHTRRKNPHEEITLGNGIKIKGFTTGTDGNGIRGQSAQFVVIDEGAYVPPEAFKAIMAFKLDNANVPFLVASTPSMLETNFKNWCLVDPAWKDYHYKSSILPKFHEKDEAELRMALSADGYQTEVEAEFIEGSARVFKSHNIKNSKQFYHYNNSRRELSNPDDWYITIGEQINAVYTQLVA